MPLTADGFEQRTEDEILAFLQAELRNEFGEDIDLTESSVFRTFAQAISSVDAEQVEPALEEVYQSAFLESASGENLEKVVAILGITRRNETHATGVLEFQHSGVVTSNYSIQNGTIAQTAGDGSIEYETTELVELNVFDRFESGSVDSNYKGTQSSFSVVDGSASGDPDPVEGGGALKAAPNSGDKIYKDNRRVERGTKMKFRNYLQDSQNSNDAECANMFGVRDGSNYYRVRISAGGLHVIEIVTSNGATILESGTTAFNPHGAWITNEIDWEGAENGRIVSRIKDTQGNVISEIKVTDESEIDEGGFGFEQLNGVENVYFDNAGEWAVQANARARVGGIEGNVGANSITVLPSVPNGVDAVTNPWPMGDDDYYDTDTTQFATGRPAETDEELRDRAGISEGRRGKATAPSIIADMSALPEAESISVYENKTDTDNTGSGGLPPHSFEVVYFGSDPPQRVADQLFDTKGFTAWDYGGAHGTEVTETVEAENGQVFTMHWTEPNEVQIDMTLDIVVNDEFVGKDEIRRRIVGYIGGTLPDGTSTLGIGTDEEVYVDQIEDIVTGPDDTGVIGIASYSFTPSTTTDPNGLEVVDIGGNEVAKTNAEDGSITINVTRV
jgi:uncharacterized phage protein gp47/JayE